jgi:cytochrome c oxidase subunit 1
MHWLGLVSHATFHSANRLTAIAAWIGPMRTFITFALFLTVFAQALFLFNFLWSLFRGEKTEECNPWRATTLEWNVSSPPPPDDFGARDPVIYRGAYEFNVPGVAEDFVLQHLAPEEVVRTH